MTRRQRLIGVSACLASALAVLAWRWQFPPFPSEQQVIGLYTAHRQEFAALSQMIDGYCAGPPTPEAVSLASRIDPSAHMGCDYDGTLRFILGVRGVMTVGPERVIGLTYIPGDPARKGKVVPALRPFEQQVGEVYLRQVDVRWYVFTQNSD